MIEHIDPSHQQRIARIEQGLRPADAHPDTHSGVRSLVERMEHYGVPGVSIAVIDGGTLAWARGYGVREAGIADPIMPDTLFQACSISKAVTAVAVLRLVQEGKLDLDEDVNRYLVSWQVPRNGPWQPRVTLRQLLSHTAGVSLPWSAGYHPDQEIPTLAAVLEGAKPSNYPGVQVTTLPGLHFQYSAGGYCILQQLLQDVQGQMFPALMHDLVLHPCQMQHSTFEQPLGPERQLIAATGHRDRGRPVAGKWHVYPELAAGGLWTTPSDLARMALRLQAAYAGDLTGVLTTATAAQMLTRHVAGDERGAMGLGVFLEGNGSNEYFGHPGDNEGFTGCWRSLVASGEGAVVLTNGDGGWLLQNEIMAAIAAEYHWPERSGQSGVDMNKAQAIDQRFAGDYQLRGDVTLRVRIVGPSLQLHVGQQLPIALVQASSVIFRIAGTDGYIEFLQQADGRITGLVLHQADADQRVARRCDT